MNIQAKHSLTLSILPRYLRANKEGKKRILDEYLANTRYHKRDAIIKPEYQLTLGISWIKQVSTQERVKNVYDIRARIKKFFLKIGD